MAADDEFVGEVIFKDVRNITANVWRIYVLHKKLLTTKASFTELNDIAICNSEDIENKISARVSRFLTIADW